MKRLVFKDPYNHHADYVDDIRYIVKVFADRGYEISDKDAILAWESYSESYAAGWLNIYLSEEEVFNECFKYFEEL